MKSERIRLGVFGAGMIATHPGGVLPNMGSLAEDVEVCAIASRTRGRAEAVAHRFGIANVRDSLREMLSADDLDVFINLTPVRFISILIWRSWKADGISSPKSRSQVHCRMRTG